MAIENISAYKSFGGWQKQYSHHSSLLNCMMRFSIYLPPQVKDQPVPVIYWLSGLTCTDENFVQKSGAQRIAAQLGVAIVSADTSPRGNAIADAEGYDLGQGAGFYVNATQAPWNQHYRMYDYILDELPQIIEENFPVSSKRSISGHSMGGHGALMLSLKNPSNYVSASAFSPISNPINCPWGEKAFSSYLGGSKEDWKQYDSSELMRAATSSVPTLVSQGGADEFLAEQLKPENLEAAANASDYPLKLIHCEGYDHSYFFIASFIKEHLQFHASHLLGQGEQQSKL